MARTLIDGLDQILAGSVGRASMNTATTGQALITKVIAGTAVSLSSTGVDAGTGDVTVNISLASPPAIGGTTPNAGTFNPLTATGQFTCTYNAGPLAYPAAANGGAMMWNYISGAAGEVDFWNLDTAATTAFSFLQLTGPASFTAVATILPNGTFSSPIAIFNTLYSTGVSFTGGTINNVPVGNTTPSSGAFTTLSASSGLNGTAVGNTTASTGAFTSLSATGLITFTAGTIDGVIIGGTTPSSAAFSSLTVASSPVVQVWIMGPAASPRSISFLTSPGFAKWDIGADSAPETGSSAGSNFEIVSYSDLGAGTVPLTINRATGLTGLTSLSVSGVTTITAAVASVLSVSDSAYGSSAQFLITGTGTNGANIKLTGSGATTPAKYIRAYGGVFQILNSAYSATIFSVNDGGTIAFPGNFAMGANTAGALTASINAAAATNRQIDFQTAGSHRWIVRATSMAESGSNAGTNFSIDAYSDTATLLYSPIAITRSTGLVTLAQGAAITGGTIDNAGIGGTTPAAGKFTTLSASSGLNSSAVGNTTASTGAFTTLSASSTVSGTGFSTYLASPPAIGGTTPAAGSFAGLSASGQISASGGILIPGSSNSLMLYDATQGTDAKYSQILQSGGVVNFRLLNDSLGSANLWLTVSRTGYVPNGIDMYAVSTNVHGNFTVSGTVSGTGFSGFALSSAIPIASSTTPNMDGAATWGTGTTWARSDHVHPVDTSRLAASGGTISGSLVVGAPTGGAMGTGTVNATGLYINGAAVASPTASSATPNMDGVGAAGSSVNWAHGDHTHPSDTSRLASGGGTLSGNLTLSGGITTLNNATSNWLNFGTIGVAVPALTTRSPGTKIVLYDTLSSSLTDYALGISSSTLWFSVPSAAGQFQWYAGTSVIATLGSSGLNVSSGNVLNDCGRNRVDNGNMEVAQRALPVTITGNYVLDRWRCGWSAGTGSATQTTFGGYTSRKQLALTVTGLTAGNVAFFIHRIEAARCADLAGQTVTVSFNFAYTISAGTTAFACILAYPTIVDAFGTVTTIATVAFTPSGTAGTYSATFAVPSAATTGLQITVQATQASATGTLFAVLTSVQLEAGASATQFERLDPAENLQRCQWFCQYHLAVMAVGYNAATGQVVSEFSYPVTMRAIPVLTIDSPAYGNASAFAQNAIYASHVRVQAIITTTGLGWGVGNLLLSADL